MVVVEPKGVVEADLMVVAGGRAPSDELHPAASETASGRTVVPSHVVFVRRTPSERTAFQTAGLSGSFTSPAPTARGQRKQHAEPTLVDHAGHCPDIPKGLPGSDVPERRLSVSPKTAMLAFVGSAGCQRDRGRWYMSSNLRGRAAVVLDKRVGVTPSCA